MGTDPGLHGEQFAEWAGATSLGLHGEHALAPAIAEVEVRVGKFHSQFFSGLGTSPDSQIWQVALFSADHLPFPQFVNEVAPIVAA